MQPNLSDYQSDNPIVQRILDGSAPQPIRQAAARGALPFSPDELFRVLYLLSADADEDVRSAVDKTVAGFDDGTLAGLLRDPELDPPLLDFFARRTLDKPQALETVISHASLPDASLEHLAGRVPADALEIIATNQVRLIRCPEIIDAILHNPALTGDIRRRMAELREEFFVKKELEEQAKAAEAEAERELTEAELARLQQEELKKAREEFEAGRLQKEAGPVAEIDEDEIKSTAKKVAELTVPQRIKLALRGNRSERSVLIRDPNRLVAVTVMASPKLSESEVELIANMRNVQEEVLRIIGTSRQWLRSYSIVHCLVKNPRCPIPVAMNLINRLTLADLKKLEVNRNVSEALRKQAKLKMQRAGSGARR